jgi:selenocysteine-specific elongation factor
MTHVVIGTAGHIDHGKTALVRALTGTDTDQLAEEQARGMTIDLGFAFLSDNVTIIDVPGHEKFIRNMVAGVSTIHLAMLVVAADDGIMPQTREHLQILKLLNIPQCVVAISKIDLAEDEEWLDLVELDIREVTDGIFKSVDVIRTSVNTGIGIAELKNLLEQKAVTVDLSPDKGFFRLQVDRVFSMAGFGTVTTGTVISGDLKKGSIVDVLPGNIKAKVRGIQSHGLDVQSVQQGDRAAVNLSGVNKNKVFRGSELALPGKLKSIKKFTAHIQLASEMKKELKHHQRVRVHLGTAEVLARVYLSGKKKLPSGSTANVNLDLEKSTVAASGDRFVLRTYSPMITIGGGTVLTTFIPKGVKVNSWVSALDVDPVQRFGQLVDSFSTQPHTISEWALLNQCTDEKVNKWITKLDLQTTKKDIVFTHKILEECKKIIVSTLNIFHQRKPLRRSMGVDILQQESRLSTIWLEEVVAMMKKEGTVKFVESGVALTSYKLKLVGGTAELSRKMENNLTKVGLKPLTTAELSQKYNENNKRVLEVLHVLKGDKKVSEIENGIWMHNENIAKLRQTLIKHFNQNNEMEVNDFKNITALTRKFAIPMLEYCDKQGWTHRTGNQRYKGDNL